MEDILEPEAVPETYESTHFSRFLPLRDDNYRGRYTNVPGKPKTPPEALPPNLTPLLNLEDVSDIWRAEASASLSSSSCDANEPEKRCIFSWISGLSQQQKDSAWIESMFKKHTKENTGWKIIDENGKIGYMPTKIGDKMVLEFTDLAQPISSVTFFIMKSYGEKWEGSRLRASVAERHSSADWGVVDTVNLSGVHAKNTSEMYPEKMNLPHPIPTASSLQVSYELTGGTTFKIMGLAICS